MTFFFRPVLAVFLLAAMPAAAQIIDSTAGKQVVVTELQEEESPVTEEIPAYQPPEKPAFAGEPPVPPSGAGTVPVAAANAPDMNDPCAAYMGSSDGYMRCHSQKAKIDRLKQIKQDRAARKKEKQKAEEQAEAPQPSGGQEMPQATPGQMPGNAGGAQPIAEPSLMDGAPANAKN